MEENLKEGVDWKWHYYKSGGRVKLLKKSCVGCGKERFLRKHDAKKEKCRSCSLKKQSRETVAINNLFQDYKKNARVKGLDFEIDREIFEEIACSACFYCGQEPKERTPDSRNPDIKAKLNGIDRVTNDIGYIKENLVPCCKWCNYAKRNGDKHDFIEHCKRVANWQNLDEDNSIG